MLLKRLILSFLFLITFSCGKKSVVDFNTDIPIDSNVKTDSLEVQEISKGLIFSEVYLYREKPSNNWVEIYNPTDNTLTLERFRLSNLRSLSQLPPDISRKEGLKIKPNECIIVCAEGFHNSEVDKNNVIIVEALSRVSSGGFIMLRTKEFDNSGEDAFRYGDPLKSIKVEKYCGSQVIDFSENQESYTRSIARSGNNIIISNFQIGESTPGKVIK